MIDFTNCPVNKFKGYGGANGNKINVLCDGTSYMLKFPPVPMKSKVMSYTNSCISEYLACHIFETLGFTVQETLLGTYTDKRGKEKIVVACKDFTADGKWSLHTSKTPAWTASKADMGQSFPLS